MSKIFLFIVCVFLLEGCVSSTTYLMRNKTSGQKATCSNGPFIWEKKQCDKCVDDLSRQGYVFEKIMDDNFLFEYDSEGHLSHSFYYPNGHDLFGQPL